jgi:hypothetical protein
VSADSPVSFSPRDAWGREIDRNVWKLRETVALHASGGAFHGRVLG